MSHVLVDTSAWVEFFRIGGNQDVREDVSRLLDENAVLLCGTVFAEILKGARTEKEFRELEDKLATLPYLETPESLWKKTGRMASQLLRKGVQVPTTDLLIAAVAIENRVPLMHQDKHFTLLARHTDLKTI